jgi:YD repeat-containing protein/predicted outer membrane repeat protein
MKKIIITTILILNALLAFSQTTYQYDNLYRLWKVNYPNGTTVVYNYDELGNRTKKTITGDDIAVTGISLDKTDITLSIGQTEQLTPTVSPNNATYLLNWTSSDEEVATVTSQGKVTAQAAGNATITVTADGKSATCSVTVIKNDDGNTSVFSENFENGNGTTLSGWTFVNGNQTNQWHVGTATNNGGNKAAYISNDGGISNTYDTENASIVHLYRDITFPATTGIAYVLSFDYKTCGSRISPYEDKLEVYLVPASVTPVAGSALDETYRLRQIEAYAYPAYWIHTSDELRATTYMGTSYRLVFTWRNDNNGVGEQPPAAIDNVSLVAHIPRAIHVTNTDNGESEGSLKGAVYSSHSGDTIRVAPHLAGQVIAPEYFVLVEHDLTIEGNGVILSGDNAWYNIFILGQGHTPGITVNVSRIHFINAPDGAVRCGNGTINLQSCIFSNNNANSTGGAIYVGGDNTNAYIKGCTFYNNHADQYGGAIYVESGTATLTGNLFFNNKRNNNLINPIDNNEFWGGTIISGGYNVYDQPPGNYDPRFNGTGDVEVNTATIHTDYFHPTTTGRSTLQRVPNLPDFPITDFYGASRNTYPAVMGAVIGDYTVTFSMQTGDANPVTVVKANSLVPAHIAPERKGYAVEWFKEAGCINKWNFAGDLVTQDITLYAKWMETTSSDATLSNLTVSSGTLVFDVNTTDYTVNVTNDVTSIDVIGTANHEGATVAGNVIGKTLNVGDNLVSITVTAEDGITTKTYTVTVHRFSNDATLSDLTVNVGTLSFDAGTTSYTVNVGNDVTNITLTATKNHEAASVDGDGLKTLNVGDNTFDIVVTAEDGTTTTTYKVTVVRAASSDASLRNLTVSSGTLSFDAETTSYTVNVGNDVTNITLTATKNHEAASVGGDGLKTLNVGDNTFDIVVTAEDGTTTTTYKVTIVRAASSDASLRNLTVSSGTLSFDAETTSYTVNVANNVTSIDVTGTANHDGATVEGNVTNKTLDVGDNPVSITVTAEDGVTTRTYTVTVHRFSNDATLSSLTLSSIILTPAFNADITSYTVNVLYDVTNTTVTGKANHTAATVTGNGNKDLATGDNVITITVTAEDGVTTKEYTVTVIRNDHVLVTEASLISLIVNDNPIGIKGSSFTYMTDCEEDLLSLRIQASPYATVTVNNVPYNPYQFIPLTENVTTINIGIAAETGGALNNYTLKVAKSIDGSHLYYKRWSDVLAINRNPANNGGYDISAVRWYKQDGTSLDNAAYIQISGSAADYYAEVKIDGVWHRACNSETKSIEKVVAYPNPITRGESVTLQLPKSFVGGVLNIYDVKGALVKSGLPLPAISNSINISGSGIYLLHVTGKDGNKEVVKIIIE